jgi:hypothetical protein
VGFLHCRSCGEIIRLLAEVPPAQDEDLRDFRERHDRCEVRVLVPTGRALAYAPWHEPLTERCVEVDGGEGPEVLVGRREKLAEPIHWTLVSGSLAETVEVELDQEAFWAEVDEALYPHHLPAALIRQWGAHVATLVRRASAEDVVVLEDDPQEPWVSHGCLVPTACARLQTSIQAFGFDATTQDRLSSAFVGAGFPPLRITRRLATASPGPGGGGEGRVSAGGGVPPAES